MTNETRGLNKLKLPPLNRLRAFEAAARHLSFTKAAEELHVTQGAVSHSVKALEDYLGIELFQRTTAGLELSQRSKVYARAVTEALSRVHDATENLLSSRSQSVLTIRGYTSFQTYWLVPRLPDFQIRHPEIEVRLVSANDRVKLDMESVDVRIRLGNGQWPQSRSVFLFNDDLTPICSPRLLPEIGTEISSAFSKVTLLHSQQRKEDWPNWFANAGIFDFQPKSNLVFEEQTVVYQAALSGLGVALGQSVHVKSLINSGQLVVPVDRMLHWDRGYYMTYNVERGDVPKIAAFKSWLTETLAAEQS